MNSIGKRDDSMPLGFGASALRTRADVALRWWLPVLPAALLMLLGFLRLQQAAPSAAEQLYEGAATAHLAWSDIISIYGRNNMAGHPFPFGTGHPFEYPVLTGLVFWLAGFAGYTPDATPAFTLNFLLLALAGLGLIAMIALQPGANPWLLALSPALVLYTGANWDLLAILPGVAALLLYTRGRDAPATVLLALSVWLKFFAVLWLPLVLIERARRGRWADCLRIIGLFAALSVLINLPFALRNRDEWGRFFTFNRERAIEVNVWTIIRDYHLSVDTVNNVTALTIVAAIVALGAVQWRRHDDCTIPASALLITWFFFINKVYSPQYFIWLVPFLALLAAPLWLFVALSFVDVIYYVASFQILHFGCPGCDPAVQTISNWDFDHVLEPAMELRELLFLVLIVWIALARLRPPTQAPVGFPEPDGDGQVLRLR